MSKIKFPVGLNTTAIHAGEAPDPVTRASAPNIVMSTTFVTLPSHPQHELAQRQMRNFSGMLTFQIENGREAAGLFAEHLQIIHYAVSLGHHRSLIFYLSSDDLLQSSFKFSTSEQLASWREYAGDGIFRLSVGLEDAEDIIHDLEQVLEKL